MAEAQKSSSGKEDRTQKSALDQFQSPQYSMVTSPLHL